jgi:hypothetical protein
MDPKFLRLVIAFFFLVGLVAAGVALWQLKVTGHGGFEFRFHKGRYINIVYAVDALTQSDTGLVVLHASDVTDTATLRKVGTAPVVIERGKGAGWIWATRTNDPGSLVVWIETVDLGHAGEYGYVFANDRKMPSWDADRFGERWEVTGPVGDGWWEIRFNLD